MPRVPATRATVTDAQLQDLIDTQAPELSRQTRAHILALIVLETARKPTQNNLGNLHVPKAKQDDPNVLFWRPPWFELDEDSSSRDERLHELMLQGLAPSAFKAYPSLRDGMADLLRLLHTSRYETLLNARTPLEWLCAEKSSGYAPDIDPERTLPGFTSLVQRFGGQAGPGGDCRPGSFGPVDFEASPAALALGGLIAYGFARWLSRNDRKS